MQTITTNNLKNVFELYLSDCEYSKRLREATIRSYRDVFETFQKIMPEIIEVDDLEPQAVYEFFKRISTRKRKVGKELIKIGVKSSTIRTYYNKLMAFFNWLELKEYILKGSLSNKITKPQSPSYEDEKALGENEISLIISSMMTNLDSESFIFKRDLTILKLFLYTGIRKGELLGLKLSDINLEERTIYIRAISSKSKKSRTIPVHFNLYSQLKIYLKSRQELKYRNEYLIISSKTGEHLTTHGLKSWVERYKRLSGVKFHLHQFRHTFACKLALNNADIVSIMRVLGHSSSKMTEQYLRSIKTNNSKQFIDKLNF